jgi:hypothetical protein
MNSYEKWLKWREEYFMKNDDNIYNSFRSPIPKHLSPEERAEWEKNMEWEQEEMERRKKEGYYPDDQSEGIISKIKKKFLFSKKQDDSDIGYIS